MNALNYIINWARELITPSVGGIISRIKTLETKLERAIDREHDAIASINDSISALNDILYRRNRELDAAYKLLDKVSKATK